jgi:hypothetical protein
VCETSCWLGGAQMLEALCAHVNGPSASLGEKFKPGGHRECFFHRWASDVSQQSQDLLPPPSGLVHLGEGPVLKSV